MIVLTDSVAVECPTRKAWPRLLRLLPVARKRSVRASRAPIEQNMLCNCVDIWIFLVPSGMHLRYFVSF